MASILDYIEFLPRGLRRAWCELSGGHINELAGAFRFDEHEVETRAYQIRLVCRRCLKATKWYDVPTSDRFAAEAGEPFEGDSDG